MYSKQYKRPLYILALTNYSFAIIFIGSYMGGAGNLATLAVGVVNVLATLAIVTKLLNSPNIPDT